MRWRSPWSIGRSACCRSSSSARSPTRSPRSAGAWGSTRPRPPEPGPPRVPPRVTCPVRTASPRTAPDRKRCVQARKANCRGRMYERGILTESGEIDDPGMTRTNGRAFNEWLRAQLKAKKMSQRQLAQQSGVDHSTISRLVRGDRMPSLGTATKLARGLRELGENDDGPQYLGLIGGGVQNPTARVEYALRADEALSEAQVRQVMEYYLAVRMRRLGSAFTDSNHVQRAEAGQQNGRHLAPAVNGPNVPRPALVSSAGRVATDSRPGMSPRLRPVRSTDGF